LGAQTGENIKLGQRWKKDFWYGKVDPEPNKDLKN